MITNIVICAVMLAALVGLMRCRKEQQKPRTKGIALLLVVVILIAGGWFMVRTGLLGDLGIGPGRGDQVRSFEASVYGSQGYRIAAFLKSHGLAGKKILILAENGYQRDPNAAAFEAELILAGVPKEHILMTTVLPDQPQGSAPILPTCRRANAGDFNQVIQDNLDREVVISLVGLPMSGMNRVSLLRKKSQDDGQKLILLDEYGQAAALRPLVDAGRLMAVSVLKASPDYTTDELPTDKDDRYALRYEFISGDSSR